MISHDTFKSAGLSNIYEILIAKSSNYGIDCPYFPLCILNTDLSPKIIWRALEPFPVWSFWSYTVPCEI
jgi:hypothetical protein